MQKPARLKVIDPLGLEKVVALDKPLFRVGRQMGNDLQLLSGMVSRHHFEIIYEDDTYFLVDRESKSGTFVNRQRVLRHPLRHLDRISVGLEDNYSIQFIDETISEAPSATTSGFSVKLAQAEAASAAFPKEELRQLLRFVEVNQAFNFSLSPDDVLCLIVDAAIEMTRADRGFLMLKNAEGNLEVRVARDIDRHSLSESDINLSRAAVEEALKKNRSVIVTDRIENDAVAVNQSEPAERVHTIACIPLQRFQMSEKMDATSLLRREVTGVLYVDSSLMNSALSKTSVTLLESLAFEASKSLESVRLMHEEQEKQRYEREFAMAREVQVALLPTTYRQRGGFAIAAQSIPCRYVGGDFYDMITMKDGRVVMTLGDVSGKGISAALLASMAQGVIHALLYCGMSLADVMTHLNRVLVEKSASDRFITLFCGLLDEDQNFSFVNAGHNPPILLRADGRKELLSTQSIVLGAFDFAEYHALQLKLNPADVIVTFTDGVTEAVNGSNEMFGDDRLEHLVRENSGLSAEKIRDRILEEVLSFTRGLPQGDDITLMVLKMKDSISA